MNKTEAKKMVIDYLNPYFISKGFELKISNWSGFKRDCKFGYDWFFLDLSDYNPYYRVQYSIYKRINSIIEIYESLYHHLRIEKSEQIVSLCFSYETLNNLNYVGYLPEIKEPLDVQENSTGIIEFMDDIGFPLLDRFNNIREIDKEINGKDFWDTDWRKPFNLCGGFEFKRTIIAYLCSNENLEKIIEYHIKDWQDNSVELPKCLELIEAYKYLLKILPNFPIL